VEPTLPKRSSLFFEREREEKRRERERTFTTQQQYFDVALHDDHDDVDDRDDVEEDHDDVDDRDDDVQVARCPLPFSLFSFLLFSSKKSKLELRRWSLTLPKRSSLF